jgi:L-threonylcarbamoyladenylate synthase
MARIGQRSTRRLLASRPADLAEAARLLRAGALVAFPTETVYGLGALALDPIAVRAIFAAKGRPSHNPLIVHVNSVFEARALVAEWPAEAEALARAFWPGPLTLVLPRRADVPDEVTAGGTTVAVRVPLHPVARELLERVGAPIAAPSANKSEHVSPTTAAHVLADLDGRIDAVLDGGQSAFGIESTVVWAAGGPLRVLRPGSVTRAMIEEAVGAGEGGREGESERGREGSGEGVGGHGRAAGRDRLAHMPLASPGQLARHYAPAGDVRLLDAKDLPGVVRSLLERPGASVGVLLCGTGVAVPPGAHGVRLDAEPQAYAKGLYAALRDLEELGCGSIVLQRVPDGGEWEAIADRLGRAAG